MRYLLLIYLDEKEMDALPAAEMNSLNVRHLELNDALRASGHFIAAEASSRPASTACRAHERRKPTSPTARSSRPRSRWRASTSSRRATERGDPHRRAASGRPARDGRGAARCASCSWTEGAMKYVCFICVDEKKLAGLSRSETRRLVHESIEIRRVAGAARPLHRRGGAEAGRDRDHRAGCATASPR
jgi:hypothetical protein